MAPSRSGEACSCCPDRFVTRSDGAWDESGTGLGGADRLGAVRAAPARARPADRRARGGGGGRRHRRAGARAGRAGPGRRPRSARSGGARRRGGLVPGRRPRGVPPGVGGAPVRGHRAHPRDLGPARRRRPPAPRGERRVRRGRPRPRGDAGSDPHARRHPAAGAGGRPRVSRPTRSPIGWSTSGTRARIWSSTAASSRCGAAWSTCSPATRDDRSAWSTGARRSSRSASSHRPRSSPRRRSRACSCRPCAS